MQSLIITHSGEELISKLIAETATASFTKIAASDHDYSGVELKALTELEDVKQTELISGISRVDGTLVVISAAMDNCKLESGYYTRALGLYAQEVGGDEILFAVSIEPDTPSYLPPFSGKTVSSIDYTLNVKVNNSEQVIIEVTPGAYATAVQLSEAVEQINSTLDEQAARILAAKTAAEEVKSAAESTAYKDFSVPADAWAASDDPGFPFAAEISDETVTADHIAHFDFDKASILAAMEAVIITGDTSDGKIMLLAKEAPTVDLSGAYTIKRKGATE